MNIHSVLRWLCKKGFGAHPWYHTAIREVFSRARITPAQHLKHDFVPVRPRSTELISRLYSLLLLHLECHDIAWFSSLFCSYCTALNPCARNRTRNRAALATYTILLVPMILYHHHPSSYIVWHVAFHTEQAEERPLLIHPDNGLQCHSTHRDSSAKAAFTLDRPRLARELATPLLPTQANRRFDVTAVSIIGTSCKASYVSPRQK